MMSEVWKIEKYARYLTSGETEKGQWQQYDDSGGDLVLTLTDTNYMVLCRGTTVMESHSLVTVRAWMRGMTKRDSMLVMYKIKNETRRFRLKFYGADDRTADQQCARCAEKLSRFFPIKLSSPATTATSNLGIQQDNLKEKDTTDPQSNLEEESLQGEVTLGKMAQVLSGEVKVKLPMAYQQCDVQLEDVDTVIRLCLTDPTFPAFVQRVDDQLHRIIADSS